jgi:hypothetical protein
MWTFFFFYIVSIINDSSKKKKKKISYFFLYLRCTRVRRFFQVKTRLLSIWSTRVEGLRCGGRKKKSRLWFFCRRRGLWSRCACSIPCKTSVVLYLNIYIYMYRFIVSAHSAGDRSRIYCAVHINDTQFPVQSSTLGQLSGRVVISITMARPRVTVTRAPRPPQPRKVAAGPFKLRSWLSCGLPRGLGDQMCMNYCASATGFITV